MRHFPSESFFFLIWFFFVCFANKNVIQRVHFLYLFPPPSFLSIHPSIQVSCFSSLFVQLLVEWLANLSAKK